MNIYRTLYTIYLILILAGNTSLAATGAGGLDLGTGDGSVSGGDSSGGDGSSNGDGGNSDGNGGDDGSATQNDPQQNAQQNPQQNPQQNFQQDPRQNMFARQQPSKPVECFGIMGTGQNDNVFVGEDGHQYGYGEAPACHPQGSIKLPPDNPQPCENIVVGQTAKGELIRGSLKPDLSRHNPEVCYPYDFIKKQITYMNPDYATPMQ